MVVKILNVFLIFSVFTAVVFAEPRSYLLGVTPQYDAAATHKEWLPIVVHLEKSLGIKLTLKLYNNVDDFELDLFSGRLDFYYMSPHHLVRARKSMGFEPLITSSDEKLFGIIVVPINSSIKTISDLKNKTIAFPAITSFAASLLIRSHLTKVAKVPFTAIYLGNHSNAYRAVLYGKASAAGGVNKSFAKEPLEVRQKLRIIFTTPETTSLAIAAGKNVSKDLKKRVTKELISYSLTEEGAKVLAQVGLSKPVTTNYEKDYKIIEKLNLEEFLKP